VNKDLGQSFHILENVIFLKKTALFSSMRTAELKAVAAIAEELSLKPGQEIVREGDIGDSMYLIRQGTVRILKKIDGEESIPLAQLSEGDCFGEMAIFDAETRSASVYTKDSCVLLRVSSDDMIDVMLENPTIAIELLRIFVGRLRHANGTIQQLAMQKNNGGNRL
jgi:CRP-like cAMP-binding protein